MRSAAFFDLDRTLLKGASGRIIGRYMREAGFTSSSLAPFENVLFGVFDTIGETWPAMLLTKQGARAAKGWEQAKVQRLAEDMAEELAAAVLPYARSLIEEHRAAGRKVVLATTTPADLITPMAKLLGLDDVIATRYGVTDGRYDGSVDGIFVWGKGKKAAVISWADRHGLRMSECYAYSDSYYDLPLLESVGYPHAVNPDPRLTVVATARRWPVVHLDLPPGIPKIAGVEPQKLVMTLTRPEFMPGVRWDIKGVDRIPDEGPAIIVANHRSYFDPMAVGMLLARKGRAVRFLGKKEVFDAPLVGDLATALGGIRVDRGTGDDQPLRAAEMALAAGELVAMMPQGTIPRGEAFFDPVLRGRWGAAKLAAETKAPIIPVGLWGTEDVWPRSSRVPSLMRVWDPPRVHVRVGAPVEMKYRSADADTKRIMAAISALLPARLRSEHEPSEDELRRTYPPGWDPENATEDTERRPGQD